MDPELSTCKKLVAETHTTHGVDSTVGEMFHKGDWLYSHASALVGKFIYVTGGYRRGLTRSAVHVLDTGKWEWSQWQFVDELPTGLPVGEHVMVLIDDRVFAFAGYSKQYKRREPVQLYALDLPLKSFAPQYSRNEVLIPRGTPAAEYVEKMRLLVVYGGFVSEAQRITNHLVGYDVSSNSWAKLGVKGGSPTPRRGHASCMHGDSDIIYFGGENERNQYVSTVNILSCHKNSFVWSEVLLDPMPYSVARVSMCCVGDRLIIFGGFKNASLSASSALYVYDVRTRKGKVLNHDMDNVRTATGDSDLSDLQLEGLMKPSATHSAVVLSNMMIVVGGLYKDANEIEVLRASE